MGEIDRNWHSLQAIGKMPAFLDLDIDCTAVGISHLGKAAVQVKEILYLEGEIHTEPEILQRHCASLIAIWSTVKAASLIDLGSCACVGKRFLPSKSGLGRCFAIHALQLDATQLLFVVISYTSRWSDIDRVKNLVVELTEMAQQVHATACSVPCLPQANAGSGFDWHLFTSREVEILKLLASGLSNKQIARQLGSSPNTVRNQIHSVFQKAGVTNRTELALRVASAG